MALIPIMAARITIGTLEGSYRAFVRAAPSVLNKNHNAHTTSFCHEDKDLIAQDIQTTRGVHTTNSKSSSGFLTIKDPNPTMTTRHLILMRHAEEENTQNENAGLTVIGREQASLVGKRLFEMDLPVNTIVHSSRRCAVETSNMIASYLPDTRREVDSSLQDTKQESVEKAAKKYLSVDPIKQTGESYDLVVCDEDMIKRLISRAMNLKSVEQIPKFQLPHASVSELSVHANGLVSVRALDDPVCTHPSG